MLDKTTQGLSKDQTTILQVFSRALRRESHVLTQHPSLLWQQLYNRLQWEGDEVKHTLTSELERRTMPRAIPWDDLPEREREKNLAVIQQMPALLARVGFQIDRLENPGSKKPNL